MALYEDCSKFREKLKVGKVEKMCDSSDMIDGKFDGLFIGKESQRFIFLSRLLGVETPEEKKNILKWNLSGEGYLNNGCFLFDGFEEMASLEEMDEDADYYSTLIDKSDSRYEDYNEKLEAVNL